MKWFEYLAFFGGIAFIATICVFMIFIKKRNVKKGGKNIPLVKSLANELRKSSGYLTTKEAVFFKTLRQAAALMGHMALPKVLLQNIVKSTDAKLSKKDGFNAIIDFCLFSQGDYMPIIAIDLYDSLIGETELTETNPFAVKIIRNAMVPFLKIDYDSDITPVALKTMIDEALTEHRKTSLFKEDN